jgi:hypothetical protein
MLCLPEIGAHIRVDVLSRLVTCYRCGNTTWIGGRSCEFVNHYNSLYGSSRREVVAILSAVTCGKVWVQISQSELKVRTNPQRELASRERVLYNIQALLGDQCHHEEMLDERNPGINEAELAMRDEPDVELRCLTIRSSRSHKRC